jgi:hypothetical protein
VGDCEAWAVNERDSETSVVSEAVALSGDREWDTVNVTEKLNVGAVDGVAEKVSVRLGIVYVVLLRVIERVAEVSSEDEKVAVSDTVLDSG